MENQANENTQEKSKIDKREFISRLIYNPTMLEWKNFGAEQPESDHWFLLWCPMGKMAPDLFLTYRDREGNYDLPENRKKYAARAWAYVILPDVNEEEAKKVEKELLEKSSKNEG